MLLFSLSNAPRTFERLMDDIFDELKYEYILVYLDDILCYATTWERAVEGLTLVFEKLRWAGLKLKPSKCHLFRQEVAYLGHIVSKEGIKTDPAKGRIVQNWPVPTSDADVRSFLGCAGYYRRFIKDYSEIAQPLTALLKKHVQFIWSSGCQGSFETLKEKLTTAPILTCPVRVGTFILDTDASKFVMGAVLQQVQEGEERVICYGSKTFSKSQQPYCVTKRELYAVIYFVS